MASHGREDILPIESKGNHRRRPNQGPQRSPDHEREVGMTRTNATTRSGSSLVRRRLVILPVALALAVAPAAPALATSGGSATSNYGTKAPEPTKPGNGTGPSSGTSPSKSTKTPTTPSKETAPATTSSTPSATKPAKASTLPFTGFDLRWTVGAGLLLVCAGGSIMVMQRRQRRDTGR